MTVHRNTLWLAVVAVSAAVAAAGTLKEHNRKAQPQATGAVTEVARARDISVGNDFLDEVQQIQRVLLDKPSVSSRPPANQDESKGDRRTPSAVTLQPTPVNSAGKGSEIISKRAPEPLVINDVRGGDTNRPAYTIVEPVLKKRQGQPSDSFVFPQKVSSQERKPSIPIDRFGVSEIESPLFHLQQQLLNGGAKSRTPPPSPSPAPGASEEYFWDTEGDADYLNDRGPSNSSRGATTPAAAKPSKLTQSPPSEGHQEADTLNNGVDTFNIVITKNSTGIPSDHKLKLLPNSQVVAHHLGPHVASPAELEQVVQSAVRAAVSSSTNHLALEEAVAQVVETPGQATTVNVINSSIADLTEIESALNTLLGEDVVYRKLDSNRGNPHGLALGYIPKSNHSVVDKILNGTLGISDDTTSGSKTNVVNIFIINVIGQVNDLLQVNNWTNSEEKLNLEQLTLEKTNNKEEEIFKEVFKVRHQSDTQLYASKTPTPQPQKVMDDGLPVERPGEVSNSQGINLNQNTVLNLLPDFIRATTIPPVVPIFNTSLHESLGTKPSVLGLLPNEVFDIKKTTVDLYDNSTGGGVIRKPINITTPFDDNTDILSIGYPNGLYQHPVFSNPGVEQPRPVSSNPYGFRSNFGSIYDFNPNRVLAVSPSSNVPQTDRSSIMPVPQLVTGVVPATGSARRPTINAEEEESFLISSSKELDVIDSDVANSASLDEELKKMDSTRSEPNPDVNESELSDSKHPDSNSHELNLWHLVNYTTDDVIPVLEDAPQTVDLLKSVVRKQQQPAAVKRKTKVKDDKPEEEGVLTMDSMMKAFAIGALPSSVAVASALWPMWAPLVFGKRRRKREAKNVEPAWYSLLNGSRYHAKLMNLKKGTKENETGANVSSSIIGTSELAALIESATPSAVKVINNSATFLIPESSSRNTSALNDINVKVKPTVSNSTAMESINSTTTNVSSGVSSDTAEVSKASTTTSSPVDSGFVPDVPENSKVVNDNGTISDLNVTSSTKRTVEKETLLDVNIPSDNGEKVKDNMIFDNLDMSSNMIKSTTKRSVDNGSVEMNVGTTRKYITAYSGMPQKTTIKYFAEISPSIAKLQSMLTETTTRRSVFMTTPDLDDGKSPAQDMMLVSNFLSTALNGWSSGEKKLDMKKTTDSYIHLNISDVSPADKASGVTDSPIVLIDKVTGEIRPLSNISKNVTIQLNKNTADFSSKLDLLRNKSASNEVRTGAGNFVSASSLVRAPSSTSTTGGTTSTTSGTTATTSGATATTSGTTATTSGTTATTSGTTATTSGTTATTSGTTATTSGTTATTSGTTTTTKLTTASATRSTTRRPTRIAAPLPLRQAGVPTFNSIITTTTTAAPAPAPSTGTPGFFSLLASAFTNPSQDMANAMSFVGTITVYGAAATMPIWLPMMVGRRRRRSLLEGGDGEEGDILEMMYDTEDRIKTDYGKLAKKNFKKYDAVDKYTEKQDGKKVQ